MLFLCVIETSSAFLPETSILFSFDFISSTLIKLKTSSLENSPSGFSIDVCEKTKKLKVITIIKFIFTSTIFFLKLVS